VFLRRTAAVSLSGYLFFGSSVDIGSKAVQAGPYFLQPSDLHHVFGSVHPPDIPHVHAMPAFTKLTSQMSLGNAAPGMRLMMVESRLCSGSKRAHAPLQVATALIDEDGAMADEPTSNGSEGDSGGSRHRAEAAARSVPRFLLLDLRRVRGMDGTAASGFGTLANTLARLQARSVNYSLLHSCIFTC